MFYSRSEAQLKEWREETRRLQEFKRQNFDVGKVSEFYSFESI